MSAAYLLYRPVMDYEESIDPQLIFTSKKAAEKARDEIREWGRNVVQTMPQLDADDENSYEIRRKHVEDAGEAPYGWQFRYDDVGEYAYSFNPECVSLMELPKNRQRRWKDEAQNRRESK